MSVDTNYGYSYEYGVDIDVSENGSEEPEWQTIRFPTAIDPGTTPVTQDAATYDDLGSPNAVKLSESWTLGFGIQQQRTSTGEYLPEVEALLEAAGPDAVGNLATRRFRWYDKPAAGDPNPNDAFEGVGTVQMARAQTGNDQIGGWNVTVTGRGRRTQIANPLTNGNGN